MYGDEALEHLDNIPNAGLIRYLDMFSGETVTVTDPKPIAEFLQTKADNYHKPPAIKRVMEAMLGNGLVVSDGMDHKV